ncbi:MAG TPA: site-2 protease family protein [Anaerolineales bacterium]|nr:site-2 protease family protein [Anaerolineales bacterium]
MFLFQQLPPTRYDLRFSIAAIPVSVHPSFWLIALLFGASGDILLLPIWVLVVFVSILFHELGHALAFRRYGQRSQIVLHFAGGLTIPEPVYWGGGYANVGLTANQQIFISLAGPGSGFLFAALVIAIVIMAGGSVGINLLLGFIPLPLSAALPFGGRVLTVLVTMLLWVNIFWGLINLAPVYPLDGGSVTRNVLIQVDPIDGVRKSLWISVIAGGIVAFIGLLFFRSLFIAFLFGLLAFQSYQSLQGRY